VRTIGVVLLSPVGDKYSRLEKRVELLDGEQLVSYPRTIGLDPRVLPWTAGFDVARAGASETAPISKGIGGELGAVVAADELGDSSFFDQTVKNVDGVVRVDGMRDEVAQGLSGELVGDVQELQGPAGRGHVELVVESPDVVRMGGRQPLRGRRREAETWTLVAPWRHPQSFFAPQTLDFLAVEVVSLSTQHGMRPAIAPAGVVAGKVPETLAKIHVGIGVLRSVTLGRAVLSNDPARPPL
jgi:hypothetical protein